MALRHTNRKRKAAGSGFKCMTNVRLRKKREERRERANNSKRPDEELGAALFDT